MTTGAPQNIYNGGLQRGSVRYFDVAALVDQLEPDTTGLQLVNTSTKAIRRLVVQAGAFGEHQFADVKILTSRGRASILDPLGWLAEGKKTSQTVAPSTADTSPSNFRRPRP